MTEIDEMDIHFFFELLEMDNDQESEVRQATDEEIDAMF